MKKKLLVLFAAIVMLFTAVAANAEDEYHGTQYGDYLYYYKTGAYITIWDCDKAATEVVIPDKIEGAPVKFIQLYVFSDLPDLTSITLPSSITEIERNAFLRCPKLENVYISDLAAYLNTDFQSLLSNPMYYADKLYLNNEPITSPTIPDTVTKIPCCAFQGCDSLESITIPTSVTEIGAFAFDSCDGLKNVIYEGAREEWNAIQINHNNEALINANISYNGSGWTYADSPENEITVYVDGIDTACALVLAAYKDDSLVDLSVKECSGAEKSIDFTLPKDFSEDENWSFTAFAWDGISSMKPLECCFKINIKDIQDITDKFTDDTFLQEIRAITGKTDGEPIYKSDVRDITELDLQEKNIRSLAGIEYFINLEKLNCENNNLTTLDFSNNTELTYLNCSNNHLITLYIPNSRKLTYLDCNENNISRLDVTNCSELTYFDFSANFLPEIDVTKNSKLTNMCCFFNDLQSLDVSNNPALEILDCSYITDFLFPLDLSKNTALKVLYCNYTNLTALDISNSPELTKIVCYSTDIEQLDTSNNPKLQILNCYDMKITSLDLTNNTELTYLDCGYNEINELDVSNNTKLTLLDCVSTNISALDVSKNIELVELSCGANNLTTLDVSSNTKLEELYCSKNQLTSLDVSNNVNLKKLYCPNNQMNSADDVTGWQNSGLVLGDTFLFDPQGSDVNTD